VVERLVANEKVEGSTPFARSNIMSKKNQLNINEIFSLAVQNQKKNNHKVAKDLYNQILKINPNLVEVYNKLGFIFRSEGQNEKAKECYEKALEIKPNFISANQNLGLIFHKLGNYEQAKKYYEKVIDINPDLISVQYNLGLVFQKLGNYEEAKKCYEKVIDINPKIAEAHNNLGIVYENMGKYNQAVNSYSSAITNNGKYKEAKENLISSLTCFNSDNNNPIIKANNDLKNLHNNFVLKDFSKNENLSIFFKKSNEILNRIKDDIKDIEYIETQTYRRNSIDLNCKRHHKVFSQNEIIPKYCFSCFKIQIEPKNILELIKLFFIFDNFKFPNNNWRKCMIELRPEVSGTYKGLIYCSSVDEANKILNDINPTLSFFMINKINIKRGCSEFYKPFPDFKQINNKEPNFMNYKNEWQNIEKIEDAKETFNQKIFLETILGLSISDFLIMNHWVNYAKLIDDLSYKDLCADFIQSNYVIKKMSNQLEFRRKEFL
jgi:tetratricopeptide (TPR) repeat protein